VPTTPRADDAVPARIADGPVARRRVVLATLASGAPMGQQVYERQLAAALQAASTAWDVDERRVHPLRDRSATGPRLPLTLVASLPRSLRAAVGSLAYGAADLVHRQDLRLPPRLGPAVLTVHDLAPLHFPDEGHLPPNWEVEVRRATAVVTASDAIADELVERCHIARPVVIGHGVDPDVLTAAPLGPDGLGRLGIAAPYVLHLGGSTERKNLGELADAWRSLSGREPDLTLVLCGPQDSRRDAHFAGLPRCVLTGHLPRADVLGLLRAAAAVVVPSRYEGFGLPVLEAMAARVPVVVSRRSSLPEVCGSDGILVEPDAAGIVGGIVRALHDASVRSMVDRAAARARRATWARAAQLHLQLYDRLVAQRPGRRRASRYHADA
jgi:glycosyltransferase involved in cell wall biosynthesis